jgi:hypothetical protein
VFRFLPPRCPCLALPALAQDLPTLREARGMVFAEDGAVSWEVIADPALTEADIATLDQINQVQPQPYYAALALAPEAGLASEITADGQLPRRGERPRRRACGLRGEPGRAGAPCIVALVIRPEGWEPGRPLQLSAQATAALAERIPRASPPVPRDGDFAQHGPLGRGRGRGGRHRRLRRARLRAGRRGVAAAARSDPASLDFT